MFNTDSLKCVTWNINGLRKRKATLSNYLDLKKIDVCCLQEVRSSARYANISGYTYYDKPNATNPSIRGLGIYIKTSLPSQVIKEKRDTTSVEYLSVEVYLDGRTITIINVYNPQDTGEVPKPPDSLICSDTVLVCGDFNARHPLLGSEGTRSNLNGNVYYKYLHDTTDPVRLLCPPQKTHYFGGKLDYVALYTDHQLPTNSEVVPTLSSDHWALYVSLPYNRRPTPPPRLRYCVATKHHDNFIKNIADWYEKFSPTSLDHFNDSLCHEVGVSLTQLQPKHPTPRPSLSARHERARLIDKDPDVQFLKKTIRSIVSQLKHLASNPYLAKDLIFFGKELNNLLARKREEGMYAWAEKLDPSTRIGNVWNEIGKLQGNAYRKKNPSPSARKNCFLSPCQMVRDLLC